jgi:uncharacterized protein YoxC
MERLKKAVDIFVVIVAIITALLIAPVSQRLNSVEQEIPGMRKDIAENSKSAIEIKTGQEGLCKQVDEIADDVKYIRRNIPVGNK